MRRIGNVAIVLAIVSCLLLAAGCSNCTLCKKIQEPPPETVTYAEPTPAPLPMVTPAPVVTPAPTPIPTPVPTPMATPMPTPKPVIPAKPAEEIDKLKKDGNFTYDPNTGRFIFNNDIMFDSGSTVVKAEAKTTLTKLAKILADDELKDRTLTIIGYTDSDRVVKAATIANLKALNKAANNQGLSEARAEAVSAVLSDGGIDAKRMSAEGKGQADPVADNTSAAGKAKNRRVEIFVSPMKSAAKD